MLGAVSSPGSPIMSCTRQRQSQGQGVSCLTQVVGLFSVLGHARIFRLAWQYQAPGRREGQGPG